MNKLEDKTIGQIAASDFRAAQVFKKHGIDFSFNGKRTISEAAEENNLDWQSLSNEIEKGTEGAIDNEIDYNNWALDVLADYIIQTHHKFAETQIGLLKPQLEALSQSQATSHPGLPQIKTIFQEVAGEIVTHQKKEEIMLFPFIRKMVKASANGEVLPKTPFGGVFGKVNMLTEEHIDQGRLFDEITELCQQCEVEGEVSQEVKALLDQLHAFKKDLHQHIHLENNILFPKALGLENKLIG